MRTEITAPAGKSGLACEPFTKGEIYAVAANWAQASDPVLVYGPDGWVIDTHGRQVADFRHSDREALESVIREEMLAGGSSAYDAEVKEILAEAEEI